MEAFVDTEEKMRLSISFPFDGDKPPSMDLACVIDVSGSMNNSAACQTDGKTEYEDLGYSLLDLVKHAVKTVLKVMRPQDRVSIILFNDKVQTPFNFSEMTEVKRMEMLQFVEGIKA